ncbi:hypothetical protein IS481_17305 [Caldimonas thermodepolymerans]|jgi:hypothetical protein|uniref:Uncharacterized protein n=1 Tax=Caldimonas thermodepolymerans TaxID=215580 RepID=A0A2S5T859_9BURK|nr:hypothetical protein C1702_04080 [Caldimonas thermodepolymerans]QPC31449.1 hypothetical protein IS481_17305 [Caldimonas thermodepolymerans]RDH99578.1 hypothetical protein DES46_10559 [Caldimonas thermodepolymerans]TCP07696.1 hypothetical protein EV676_104252 [Caldimonas thermodepolymerans]
MNPRILRMSAVLAAPVLAIACLGTPRLAQAHDASEASVALSALPVVVSVAAPATLLSGGAALTVVAVEASAEGAVWVLERAADGARATLRLSTKAAGAASLAVGTVVTATAIGAGCILSAAGQVIAFIPNRIGAALLHDERLTH